MEPLTEKQIKDALKESHSEAYLRDNYKISRAEARTALKNYQQNKSKRLKRNLGILISSAILMHLLFFGGRALKTSYDNQNLPFQRFYQIQQKNPEERLKLIEEQVSPYSDIQLKLNPGQEKTLYIFSQHHMGVKRNNAGEPVEQIVNEAAVSSQTDILNTLLSINQISPLEVIIGEGIGKGIFNLPEEDEKQVKKMRIDFLNPLITASYFKENPFYQADLTFKRLYPGIILAGVDQSKFDAEMSVIDKEVGKRFALYPNIHERGQLAMADPPTMEIIKRNSLLQEKRSIDYLKTGLSYFKNHSNIAIVIGAIHPAQMAAYLKQHPQEGITSIFLISKRADSFYKSLINSPNDFENFKKFYKVK